MIKTKQLVQYSLFAALVAIVTYFGFPIAYGYINLGDSIIFSVSLVFGPIAGFISGAIGSALADITLGYAQWAPFTFIIKGGEGLLVGILGQKAFKKFGFKNFKVVLGLLLAVLWFNMGYFIAAIILYGYPAAIADAGLNLVQGVVALILTLIIAPLLLRFLKALD